MRKGLYLLVVGLLPAASPAAFAEEPPPGGRRMVLTCCACGVSDLAEVARVLLVELTGEGFVSVTAHDDAVIQDATAVRARVCERPSAAAQGVATFDVEVQDAAAGVAAQSVAILQPAEPAVRARMLAVEVAELLRASWLEPVLAAPSSPAAPDRPAAAVPARISVVPAHAARPSPPRSSPNGLGLRRDVQAHARFLARSYAEERTAVWGGGVAVRVPLPTRVPLALSGSVQSVAGRSDSSLGSVGLGEVTSGFGAGCLLRVAPRLSISVEVGLDVGLAWASGHPRTDVWAEGRSVRDIVASASGTATAALLLAGPVEAVVSLEAGRVVRGLRATSAGDTIAAIDGPFVGGSIGLGLLLGGSDPRRARAPLTATPSRPSRTP